jgi:transglutaminase/protease-like cytokinesis protein 3
MKSIKVLISLFFISHLYAQKSDFGSINFNKADSIAMAYKNSDLSNLPLLAFNLTHTLKTETEKFRAIYFWVSNNIANDYNLLEVQERKLYRFRNKPLKLKQWNKRFKPGLFRSLLKHNKTICTAYAYLLKELCYFANLKCEMIHGYGRTSQTDITDFESPNHSWNAVLLDEKWYLADATWASGKQDLTTMDFSFNYCDGYFLTAPKLFAKTHYPLDEKWLLLGNETYTFNSFLNEPVLYRSGYEKLDNLVSPKKMHSYLSTKDNAVFKFNLNKGAKTTDFYLITNNGSQSERILVKNVVMAKKVVTLKHKFKTPGFYNVHLFIKNDLVATYTFKVRK